MPADKYQALWLSHTSLSDYLKCPRAYYLKNIYKDSSTGHKIQIMGPSLALGSAVHQVIEALSLIPTETRFKDSLVLKFDQVWEQYQGKKGGFLDTDTEHHFKERGKAMLRRVMEHPGPLQSKAVKINQDLPNFFLSEEDNIILCGKIDWLQYFPERDTVNIIDFKTSKKEEEQTSLQLPIYLLLVKNCQKRQVEKASYWYLEFSDELIEKQLPDDQKAKEDILKVGRQIKLAKKLDRLVCPNGKDGCIHCLPFEKVITGKAEKVGENYGRDTYILIDNPSGVDEDSYIL